MSLVNSRAQQIAQLRRALIRDIEAEENILSRGQRGGVITKGMTCFFATPGRFPGWHAAVGDLVDHLMACREVGEPIVVMGFRITEPAAAELVLSDGMPAKDVERFADWLRARTRQVCRMCGEPHGEQHFSYAWALCDLCTTVALMYSADPEAAAARGWAP